LPFTAAYLISLGLTLYFAIGVRLANDPTGFLSLARAEQTYRVQQLQSYIGTLVAAIVQVVALLSYLVAYFP
jgi:hypothetical protein